jgi:predicted nucleic acid binding AN1-type Zn finger protein
MFCVIKNEMWFRFFFSVSSEETMLCQMIDCRAKVALLVGDCRYCQQHFCSSHRLPEVHHCTGLDRCRQIHFEHNKTKLMSEKVTEQHVR